MGDNVSQTATPVGSVQHLVTEMVGPVPANPAPNCNYVQAFALPYLAPGQAVSAATLSFYLMQNAAGQTNPNFNVQLYGLSRVSATSPSPVVADWYVGTNDTANTLLNAQFVKPTTTVNQTISYSGTNLVSFINSQYTNSAFAGMDFSTSRYIFFRLNADVLNPNNGANNYLFASARNSTRSYLPTLALTMSGGISNVAGRLQFSFSLPQAAVTSAGVYNTTTGALIRTIWNNVRYQAGTGYGAWDGNDDSGNAVATGTNYQIKMIYNNVQYIWQGIVGNTSASTSGPNVYHSFLPWTDMSINGTTAYYANGYNELQNPFHTFTVGAPQVPYEMPYYGYNDCNSSFNYMTSDSSRSYWAKCQGGIVANSTYVIAINQSDGSCYTFSNGTNPPTGAGTAGYYTSCCDFDGTAGQPNPATGLAVQQGASGDLFVSHGNLNVVRVFNKVTGALLGTISVTNPQRLAVTGESDVWVISGTTVQRYTFNNGTGTATLKQTITGLTGAAGVGVSSDGSLVFVADGGTSQQIKVFSNTSSASTLSTPLWTYGNAGGMTVNGPAITSNTFDYGTSTYIAFQPDNTFWIGDYNNERVLHFSINGTTLSYIEQIAFLGASYQSTVDLTDPTRVFNEFKEYSVDYTKTLAGTNNSWTLVRNWADGMPSDSSHNYTGGYMGFNNVVTLSNGRTYGFADNSATGNRDLFELPASGQARATGYSFNTTPRIYEDGSLRFNVTANNNASLSFYSQPLTGFDANNNPVWGAPILLASKTLGANDPIPWSTYPMRTEITASGNLIDFDGNVDNVNHLAALPIGASTWQWSESPSVNGASWFPTDGHFEIGDSVNYPGNYAGVIGHNILYGYHGEIWMGAEASKWVNYYDNGLMVGEFGTPSIGVDVDNSVDGYAGNSFGWALVKASDGNVYLYHNDESNHGGTVRWEITGWDNIAELAGTSILGSTATLSTINPGPSVTLTSPLNGAIYPLNGNSVTLGAQAESTGATISSVQFFDGSTSLGTVTASPYVLTAALSSGSHVITAKATDSNGQSATSSASTITIGSDGTAAIPPAPTSLSSGTIGSESVSLTWTEPTVGTTSSTIGQIMSFQFDTSGDSNALASTDVAGASPYAASHFNLLGLTATSGNPPVLLNVTNSLGTTLGDFGEYLRIISSDGPQYSTGSLSGTTLKLFSETVNTNSAGLSFFGVPYGLYDLVVYSLPDQIQFQTETSSVTVGDTYETTSTVNQTFTAVPTTYTTATIAFGSSSSVTNKNTLVFQGLTSPAFSIVGGNIAGFQIIERPYDQGVPTSFTIQRAPVSTGVFATVGTASAGATSYTDSSGLSPSTSYEYRICAVDGYGSSAYSNVITVTTAPPDFTSWKSTYFNSTQLSNSAISGLSATPNNDGVSNLLKYAFDINPTHTMSASDIAALPTVGTTTQGNTTYLTLTYRQNPNANGITVNVQTSSDLATWTTVTPTINQSVGTDVSTGDPLIEVGVPTTGLKRQFIRLDVTSP